MTRSTLSEISTSRLNAILLLIDDAFTSDIELITAAVVIRAELARRTNGRFAATPMVLEDSCGDSDPLPPTITASRAEFRRLTALRANAKTPFTHD
jgi:hypothetical protein